jgi:hypothetical protein
VRKERTKVYCKDCKWILDRWVLVCGHPSAGKVRYDPISGITTEFRIRCRKKNRRMNCKDYEPKEEAKTP